MAQLLLAQGQEVALLALLDSGPTDIAPHGLENNPDFDLLKVMIPTLEERAAPFRHLGPEEKLVQVIEQERQKGSKVEMEQIRNLLRVTRANIRAERGYVPRPYPGEIVLFRAIDHPEEESLDLDWAALVQGVEIAMVPGDHLSIVEDKNHVKALAEQLGAYLGKEDMR